VRLRRALAAVVALGAFAPAAFATPAAADPEASFAAYRRPADVAFSPDGAAVAFTVWRAVTGPETSESRGAIHVAAAAGGGDRALTPPELAARDPRWSPDGKAIAFRSDRSGRNQVWLVAAAGGGGRPPPPPPPPPAAGGPGPPRPPPD
jgi:dipeptidyl aminopeptidase/acylaminoacyl peptidase